MVTIRELLARVHWDRPFGDAEFMLACHDRLSGRLERLPLSRVRLETGNHFSFVVCDDDGTPRTIPFHRVREVYRNGVLIWSRPPAPGRQS